MTPIQMLLAVPAAIFGVAILILAESMIGNRIFRILESRRRASEARNKES